MSNVSLLRAYTTSSSEVFFAVENDEPGPIIHLVALSTYISQGYEVIEIAASDLSDQDAMVGYLYRLGRALLGKDKAKALRENRGWYDATDGSDN